MTEQQHVPVEDLAAFAAGDLDAAAAVTVEAHVVLCAECRSDVEAVRAATAALAAVPAEPMPALVAARLDAAIAAERGASRAPAGTVLPMARRRRPTVAGLAAVAAVVALFAALSIPLLTGVGEDNRTAGTSENALAPREAGTRRLSSGLDYSRDQLARTLGLALAGNVGERHADAAAPAATPMMASEGTPPAPRAASDALTDLRTDPGRLAGCIAELVGTAPAAGRVPLVVDFGTFAGRDAAVLVFPSIQSNGEPRAGRVDVYVVGPRCGVEPGGDLIDFQRIARPSGL